MGNTLIHLPNGYVTRDQIEEIAEYVPFTSRCASETPVGYISSRYISTASYVPIIHGTMDLNRKKDIESFMQTEVHILAPV